MGAMVGKRLARGRRGASEHDPLWAEGQLGPPQMAPMRRYVAALCVWQLHTTAIQPAHATRRQQHYRSASLVLRSPGSLLTGVKPQLISGFDDVNGEIFSQKNNDWYISCLENLAKDSRD